MKLDDQYIMRAPIINACHVKPSTRTHLDSVAGTLVAKLPFDCGWLIMAVPGDWIDYEDLYTCLNWATKEGFAWLRLDHMGAVCSDLPLWK